LVGRPSIDKKINFIKGIDLLPSIDAILFFGPIFFAGTKGRTAAKKKWTALISLLFLAGCFISYFAEDIQNSSANADVFVLTVAAAAVAAYTLNLLGRWIIDFIALNIMPDNRDRVVLGYDKPWSDL
jgi:hypothetical protein